MGITQAIIGDVRKEQLTWYAHIQPIAGHIVLKQQALNWQAKAKGEQADQRVAGQMTGTGI